MLTTTETLLQGLAAGNDPGSLISLWTSYSKFVRILVQPFWIVRWSVVEKLMLLKGALSCR